MVCDWAACLRPIFNQLNPILICQGGLVYIKENQDQINIPSIFFPHAGFTHSCFCFLFKPFLSLIFSGWCFLAPSTMWRQKCSPAALLSRCSPVRPRSGRWRRSWPPQIAWQRVRRWETCWHKDVSRLASPGWCTGRFPGRIALKLWVHADTTDVRDLLYVIYLFCVHKGEQWTFIHYLLNPMPIESRGKFHIPDIISRALQKKSVAVFS